MEGGPGNIGAGGLEGRAGAAGDTACPLERSRRIFILEKFLKGGE